MSAPEITVTRDDAINLLPHESIDLLADDLRELEQLLLDADLVCMNSTISANASRRARTKMLANGFRETSRKDRLHKLRLSSFLFEKPDNVQMYINRIHDRVGREVRILSFGYEHNPRNVEKVSDKKTSLHYESETRLVHVGWLPWIKENGESLNHECQVEIVRLINSVLEKSSKNYSVEGA